MAGPQRFAERRLARRSAANNFQAAAGQAKGYFIVSNVTTNTDLQNLDQFKRMIVKSKDGGFVRMEDIATVELAAQSTDASVAFNGEHAIFIGVQATPQGNPLTLVKGVRALFPELERNLPPSMKMKVAYDSDQIHSVLDRRGREDAGRGRAHRRRGDLPVPGLVPLGHHSRGHHSAVADRRLQPDAGGWASASTC